MTVTEKLAHAAERKAFETMLDSLIRKSRTQDVGKVADDLVSMVQRIHSSVWEPETFAMLHKIANDPNSKWAHYAERLLRECDPYLLRTFLTAAAYEGASAASSRRGRTPKNTTATSRGSSSWTRRAPAICAARAAGRRSMATSRT